MPYLASLSPTAGRPGFTVSFRHPCRQDSKGKPGLKMRRGLGTDDPAIAETLVAQMNALLSDESWWSYERLADASAKFDKRIVDAFYDSIQAGMPDSYEVRNGVIPMPSREEGYAKAMLVGTTGAGKTSLARHLIGSDPEKDRFPSTSTAKTTVSDIELIPAEGVFKAAITFFSETTIQANIEDCIVSACSAVWERLGEDKVADRFLHHADQRFRLSYLLGSWKKGKMVEEPVDEWDFGNADVGAAAALTSDEAVSAAQAEQLQKKLEDYVSRITAIAKTHAETVTKALLPTPLTATAEEREVALEVFQGELFGDEEFQELVQDVLDEARQRFEDLTSGELTRRGSSKWPILWTYESEDRADFLHQVRWFSSNFANSFGRLLTPLVEGIRVMGPLFPVFGKHHPKIILLDGQGLGHTPDSSSSVTTHITKRFSDVDIILLVDNAEQPVQAAAQSVLRAVASSGHSEKLLVAFTHFDNVKGANLPSYAAKRAHVLASVYSYLAKLKEVLSAPIVAAIERSIEDQCFMLGALDGPLDGLPPGVVKQLIEMSTRIEKSVEPPPVPNARPHYDPSGLGFAVQRAASSFQKAWNARLGLALGDTLPAEHWTRVKALNRKISSQSAVEYDSLRPVADLVGRISEEVANFLDNPIAWSRTPNDDDEAQRALAPIRQAVFSNLHGLALERLIQKHLAEWRRSYDFKGQGSVARRASEIRGIYELAAPVPGTVNTGPSLEFMRDVRMLVTKAVRDNEGTINP